MRKLIITDGAFTQQGNFTGYTPNGERVHIFKRQMDAKGWTSPEKLKMPFFVNAEEKNYEARVDASGKVISKGIEGRLTATAVFTDEKSMLDAHVATSTLDAKAELAVQQAVVELRKSYGLDTQEVAELANASI